MYEILLNIWRLVIFLININKLGNVPGINSAILIEKTIKRLKPYLKQNKFSKDKNKICERYLSYLITNHEKGFYVFECFGVLKSFEDEYLELSMLGNESELLKKNLFDVISDDRFIYYLTILQKKLILNKLLNIYSESEDKIKRYTPIIQNCIKKIYESLKNEGINSISEKDYNNIINNTDNNEENNNIVKNTKFMFKVERL